MLASERTTPKGRSFDSLAYAKSMESVGFTRQQAEMMAQKQAELVDERLATKEDIEALRLSTKGDIEALRLSSRSDLREAEMRLEAKIAETKTDILKWMFGTIALQTLVILGALVAIVHGSGHN